jgi:hypothetical protein
MPDSNAGPFALARARLSFAVTAMVATTAIAGRAWSQTPVTPPAAFQSVPAQAPGAQATPDQMAPPVSFQRENPGLINEIGKLFDGRSSIFPSTLKSPQQAIDDFNARAPEATGGLSRVTAPLMVRGRMVCPAAANGAPDCQAGSDQLCQTKGFKQGKSLDTDSAQSCSVAALLSGGNRLPGNCRTNYYVTRALCQ